MTARRDRDDELARHFRLLCWVSACFVALALLAGWFTQMNGTAESLVIVVLLAMAGPVIALVVLAAAFVLVAAGLRIGRREADGRRRLLARLSAPVVFALIALLLFVLPGFAADLHRQYLLWRNVGAFSEAIARREAPQDGVPLAGGGRVFARFDEGPPQRVYFPLAGVADNSQGFVYDPSGRVAAARRWAGRPGQFSAPGDLREVFGGDLLACTHVRDSYYYCSFT